MISHGEATFDLLSDALIEGDPDKLSTGAEMMGELTGLIQVYTDAVVDATAELAAYQG